MEWNKKWNVTWNGTEYRMERDGTEYGMEHGTDMEWNRNYELIRLERGTNTEQI